MRAPQRDAQAFLHTQCLCHPTAMFFKVLRKEVLVPLATASVDIDDYVI